MIWCIWLPVLPMAPWQELHFECLYYLCFLHTRSPACALWTDVWCVLAGYLGPLFQMHTPFSLSRRKLVANKKRTCCLMKVMNWRLGMTQVGWAGTYWHNRKMIMYWTYCAIEGLATVWTCIINQEIQYEKEETRCRETRQSSSLDILDLSVAKPFIAILNLLVGGDVWNVFYTPSHYHYALFFLRFSWHPASMNLFHATYVFSDLIRPASLNIVIIVDVWLLRYTLRLTFTVFISRKLLPSKRNCLHYSH